MEYSVCTGDINQNPRIGDETNYVSSEETREAQGGDEEDVVRITKTISFTPLVIVRRKKFALNLGSSYIAPNSMYINCVDRDPLQTQYVIRATDFGGDKVGVLEFGFLSLPLDLDDEADEAYYNEMLSEINASRRDGYKLQINEIQHRSIDDYNWSYPAYFEFGSVSGQLTINTDGYDWPISLDVLPPGKLPDDDGDVYNRVYEVQQKVYADHVDFPEDDYPGKDDAPGTNSVWIDKASIAASISANDNVGDWKKLIYKP
jgi:hypothetical protein